MEAAALISSITETGDLPTDPAAPLSGIDGWDSLAMVALVVKLEDRLGRELTESELDGLRTIGDVQSLLSPA